MAQEIERKFLVVGDGWRSPIRRDIRQGYLSIDPERTVRVRIDGDRGYLTVKGKGSAMARPEYEFEIPLDDAAAMIDTLALPGVVSKMRHEVRVDDFLFEIDEFRGDNEGLVLAEVELDHEDETFPRPAWLGEEVTGDPRYYNSNLTSNPYRNWRPRER